jgi:thioesterase domain-containing protein
MRDNFFDLGGHSLLGVRLFAQIERITGENLPLTALFQAPTIEQQARALSEKRQATSWSSLVMLRDGNAPPPIFCLPGTLGNVFTDLGDLARHLGSGQPVYGLQDGIRNPSRVKALAAHFVEEIKAVQRDGPFVLIGICSGGVVAYEMAQQLHAQGQKVAVLAMVEPSPPRVSNLHSYAKLVGYIFGRFTRRLGHHSRSMAQRDTAEQRAYLHMKAKVVANWLAMADYTVQPYPGSIHLLLTGESLSSPENAQLGWTELAADGVSIHQIPGTHDSITGNSGTKIEEAEMQALAQRLRVCIDETLANGNSR